MVGGEILDSIVKLLRVSSQNDTDYNDVLIKLGRVICSNNNLNKGREQILNVRNEEISISKVENLGEKVFYLKIGNKQERFTFQLQKTELKEIKNVSDNIGNEIIKISNQALEKICQYINKAHILKEKNYLIEKIKNIKIKIADLDSCAEYRDGIIYISNKEEICEWIFVHEYVHALKEIIQQNMKQYDESADEIFNMSIFDEVITDLITASMGANFLDNTFKTNYMKYYDYVLEYIGLYGEESLKSYYYGYSNILSEVEKVELELFVLFMERMNVYISLGMHEYMMELGMVLECILMLWKSKI